MPTWMRTVFLNLLLLLGISLALPAYATPGTNVGCGATPTSSGSSSNTGGGDVCAAPYSFTSSNSSSSNFLPPGTYSSSDSSSMDWGKYLHPAGSIITPSTAVIRAVGALGASQCAATATPGTAASTTRQSPPMRCHRIESASGLSKLLREIPSIHLPKMIRRLLLPTSGIPAPALAVGGFRFQQSLQDIDHFLYKHPIQTCTDARNPPGDGYVVEPSGLVKTHCTKQGTHLWVCHGAFATKLSDAEKKARRAKKRKDIRALEKSIEKHEGIKRMKNINCDLHHIVPSDSPLTNFQESRKLLEECGIGINNYRNGIYLPGSKKEGNCKGGFYHGSLHNEGYAADLLERLKKGYGEDEDGNGSCDGLKDALQKFKEELQQGGRQIRSGRIA